MLGALRRGAGIACVRLAFLPIHRKKLDEDNISNAFERDPDSSVDRILSVFDRNEYGTMSPELSFVNIFGFYGGMIGGMYGGLVSSRLMNLRFRESNEATVYESRKLAHRKLLDSMTLSFGKGFFRYGLRYGLFCFSISALSILIQKLRGETGILEYSIGGLISGALFKFSLGPKGMISGGFFGTLIGSFGGLMIFTLTKIADFKIEDAYKMSQTYFIYKDTNFHGSFKKQLENPDIMIETYYPDGIGSMKHTLDELEDIKNTSELKFNRNPLLKLNTESKQIVNITEKK